MTKITFKDGTFVIISHGFYCRGDKIQGKIVRRTETVNKRSFMKRRNHGKEAI